MTYQTFRKLRGILVRKILKSEELKKYSKHITIGTACAALVGVSVFSYSSEKKNDKVGVNSNIPSAGIAPLLFEEEDGTVGTDGNELLSGIALTMDKYYYELNKETISISAVETVLSMLPEKEVVPETEENTQAEAEDTVEEEPEFLLEYNNLGVANVVNYLNVREEPSTEGKLLGKLPMNAGCEILETLDGWYKITSGNVEGYVSAEFLLTGDEAKNRAKEAVTTMADVNADMLMVREQPNTDCEILTRVAEGESIEALEILDGWVKVAIDDREGYVCADYVNVHDSLPKGVTMSELSYGSGVSSTAVDLIEYAKQFLGNPYVYGGTSLTNGTDCSGFTMRIFEHFGYSLSRTSRSQSGDGTRVAISDIQPGDLLFYSYGSTIGHVAIYIGDGQIIHASTERTGIIIGNAFYTTPTCAVRILN